MKKKRKGESEANYQTKPVLVEARQFKAQEVFPHLFDVPGYDWLDGRAYGQFWFLHVHLVSHNGHFKFLINAPISAFVNGKWEGAFISNGDWVVVRGPDISTYSPSEFQEKYEALQ